MEEVCIELPPDSIIDKVDVFFLFDDTGSFAGFVPTVTSIFASLVTDLETALPLVSFGFGVGRFEDYGGPGNGFSGENSSGRPFTLNQPVVTAADAGSAAARNALINTALSNTAPGFGGDGPESAIAEGLFQVATGIGFDGDGDASTTGFGGTQVAGALATQIASDASGDVPAFSTLDAGVISSGSAGGAGFRTGALRLVILATDICSIAAFDFGLGIPPSVTGTGGTEPTSAFACSSTIPGASRFGFVSDAKTTGGNTIAGAVVPAEAGTLPATIAALNAAGIRVLGMGPGTAPTASPGPSFDPSVFLSALARITGAVDGMGNPLVFDIGAGGTPLKDAIVDAISTTVTLPIDIILMPGGTIPPGLTVGIMPPVVQDVPPGGEACFDVTFTGTGDPNGMFTLDFKDSASGAILGSVPVDVQCTASTTTTTSTTSTTTTTVPEHVQCYELKPARFTGPMSTTVEDQFGTKTGELRFPHRLCAPADKNGEGVLDPTEHLAGYGFRPRIAKVLNQTTVDQFGTLKLDVVRPQFLMVPTAKEGVPLAPPPGDHFMCYKVKRSRGGPKFVKRDVTVADQFNPTGVVVTLLKPAMLCAPANKNGEDPTAPDHPDHLVCYKTRERTRLPIVGTVDIENQFGLDEVEVIHRRELCVPALKNPPPTTTTTTAPPTTSTSTTSTSTTSTTSSLTTTTSSSTTTTTTSSSTTSSSTTTTTSSTTTTTMMYGSPSRAFLAQPIDLLD